MTIDEVDIQALLDTQVDVPDWERDVGNPAPALAHQTLVSIAAQTGLRELLEDRINELLAKHDNIKDLIDDLNFIDGEFTYDLQRALHGTDLGKQCQGREMEYSFSVSPDEIKKTFDDFIEMVVMKQAAGHVPPDRTHPLELLRAVMVATINELMPVLRPMHEFDAIVARAGSEDALKMELVRAFHHALFNVISSATEKARQ